MDSRTVGEDMEDAHERPRVRIPSRETERQNLGHNAWAQERWERTQSKQGVTIKEAGEQPAELPQMTVKTPTTPKSADLATLNPPKQRTNIKPVTPLKLNKNRAVTDPPLGSAVPPPLFAGRKVSIAELRHKFSKEGSTPIQNTNDTDSPPLPIPSDKAARVLGAQSTAKDRLGKLPPTSAPASTNAPAPYRTSTDEQNPSRQVKSTAVSGQPTSRFFNENPGSRQAASASVSSQKTYETAPKEYSKPGVRAEAMILGKGKLSPSKSGAYGRLANVQMQEYPVRVSSMVGVVENVQQGMEGGEGDPVYYPHRTQPPHDPRHGSLYDPPQLSAHALPESSYSPSIYNSTSGVSAGEWEALQQQYPSTLLPFSPRQPPLPYLQTQAPASTRVQSQSQHDTQSRDVSTASSNTLPFLFRGYPDEITPTSTTHSTYSSQPPQSFILPPPPPRPSRHPQPTTSTTSGNPGPDPPPAPTYGNFVPTPPHPHFRPSSSSTLTSTVIDEHLGAFAMELHHHIEMSSRRLLHALEARTDRLGDEIVRRLESLGEAQREGVGEVCRRVENGVREEGRRGREEVLGEVGRREERVLRGVERVGGGVLEVVERVGKLEAWVREVGCRCGEAGRDGGREKEKEKEKEKDKVRLFHKRAFSRSTNPPTSPTKTQATNTAVAPYPTDPTATTTTNPTLSVPPTAPRRTPHATDISHHHQQHPRPGPEPDLALHPAFQTPHHPSHHHSRSQPHSHPSPRDVQQPQGQWVMTGQGQGQGPRQRQWGGDERAWMQEGRGGDGQNEGWERGRERVGGGTAEVVFRAPSWGEGGWYRQAYGG